MFMPLDDWLDKHAETIKAGLKVDPKEILVDIKQDPHSEHCRKMISDLYCKINEMNVIKRRKFKEFMTMKGMIHR